MPYVLFVLQAILCLAQGFANVYHGKFYIPKIAAPIARINLLYCVICILIFLLSGSWLRVLGVVILYLIACSSGAFLCEWYLNHKK